MNIIDKNIDDLIPYARNQKKHTEEQVIKIASSIKEFGFKQPIVIDENNEIIIGHGRVLAAKKLNLEHVPCLIANDLNKSQIKALRIADNKLNESDWDYDFLNLEIEELKSEGFDIEITGFELNDFNQEIIEDEFNVDKELDNPTITKLGDLWLLGNHRLLCGDSTDKEAVEKLMNEKKADMVFTDPPYGMFLDTDYSDMNTTKDTLGKKESKKYSKVKGDNEDFDPNLISTVFENFGYCKEIFLWGADYYAELLPSKNNGSWVVWDKRTDETFDKAFGSGFELCWSKTKHKRMIARVKWVGVFGTEKEHDKKRMHPTQKPVELIKWFFDYYSLKDKNNVVDLYSGSGSLLIACEKFKKISFNMELDEKYCDVIVERYKTFVGDSKDIYCIREGIKYSYNDIRKE